ncbi:glycoside hydrolase domain-containing protein [Clostridium tarantellae]|uniref:DUF4091 domain-containing protein n=1 Tax=Clostridium tarantellae TaxID=39493 RepID=A0A6I1MSP2_9CLOT|nr:glycoside hydrolase domain-containing protein [Clostridium tarantellae]MPQ43259.1 DUF4091 domain-containing protein [Clostridium tarantellae]
MQIRKDRFDSEQSKIVRVSGKGSEAWLDMQVNFNNKDINIGSSISGKVTDSNNNGIEGAIVKLMDENLQPLSNAMTDENGNYIITSIPYSNTYTMMAISEGKELKQIPVFTISLGENKIINFTLQSDTNVNLGIISGTLLDINSRGITGAIILLYDIENGIENLKAITYTDTSGIFVFNELMTGNYKIKITALGYKYEELSIKVNVGEITTTSKVLYENPEAPDGIISGTITDSMNNTVENADVMLYSINENNELNPMAFAKANSKGLYTFINVPPGDYLIKSNQSELIIIESLTEPFSLEASSLFSYNNEPIITYNVNATFNEFESFSVQSINKKYLDITSDLPKVKNLKNASILVRFKTNNSTDVMTLFSASQSTHSSKELALILNGGIINGHIRGDNSSINIKSIEKYSDGIWHIVIMTLGPTGVVIYVDGKKVAESNTVINFTSIASLDSMNIGRNLDDKPEGEWFYMGNIGYVDIFNRVLEVDEITKLSNMTITVGYFNIPFIDFSLKTDKQIIVDKQSGVYLGHPSTVLLDDEKTMYVVYPNGHGKGPVIMKKSMDAGLTWSDRLPTPSSWASSEETPVLYKIKKPDGTMRIQMISGVPRSAAGGFRTAYSDDLGITWSEFIHRFPVGKYQGIVAHASLTQLKKADGSWDNKWMGIFHDGTFNNWKTYLSFDADGNEMWTEPARLLEPHNTIEKAAQLCEIETLRSPDGNQLALLCRCQAKRHNSMIAFSNDEGETWTEPRELQGALMGERHKATYDPISGRLLISFREIIRDPNKTGDIYNWVAGDWVGWVGTYEDLVRNREGQYRIRFIEDFTPSVKSGDCGYAGNEVISDGTFILTSYGYWEPTYDKPYIKTIRLKLEDLDNFNFDNNMEIFEFAKDFSNIQGNNGWYYKEFANGAYKDLIYNTSIGNGIWQGTHEWCRVYKPSILHPGTNQDVVLAFKCPSSGKIKINANVKKANIKSGDGVKANIKYNNIIIWPTNMDWQLISYNNATGYNQDLTIAVKKDDYIYFTINNNGNGDISQDNTFWNPKIEYISYDISVALNKPVTSSPSETAYGRGPDKGNDGDLNTRWCANSGEAYHWWQVDLLDFYDINQVEIIWQYNEVYGFAIEVSSDNKFWRVAFDNASNLKKEQVSLINLNEKSIRYVKIQMKSLPNEKVYPSFFECNVFGNLADIFEFDKDFSNIQGNKGWYYKEFVNGEYKDLTYNTSINNGIWQGSHEWCRIYKPSMLHPGPTQDIVLAFKCPKNGRINITSVVKKANTSSGNGIKVNIKYNNMKIWPIDNEWQSIKYNDSVGYNQDTTIEIEKDGMIYFTVNNNGNGDIGQDNTFWNPKIVYVNDNVTTLNMQGLHGFIGSKDKHYLKEQYSEIIKESENKEWNIIAWKGEKINNEIILWTENNDISSVYVKATDLKDSNGNIISQENISFNFLKYVHAEGSMIPDILDNINTLSIKAKDIQPLWITIKIPNGATSGKYTGEIGVYSSSSDTIKFTIKLEVLNMELPAPDNWDFHLDLWQNPYSVARYFNVPLWSTEHINYLKPHLKLLKSAGQKVITTTIMKDPWNSQTYDPYGGMVKWTKNTNGTFTFDFTDFDIYVQLCIDIGIKKQINCYSMVPWDNRVFYFDKVQNKEVSQSFTPGSVDWINIWKQFINAFVAHVKTKGWESITYIAMDERPLNDMKAVMNLLRNTPLRISGAMNYGNVSDLVDNIHDISLALWEVTDEFYHIIEHRRALGLITTYYVCTGVYPNTFTKSKPGEAVWLGWNTAKYKADGFLRWAYDSWVKDPLISTDHVKFESGDCFLVYPDARSSVRFERLIEGIQDCEKITQLLKIYPEWMFEIEKILKALKGGSGDYSVDYGQEVSIAKEKFNNIVRRIIVGEKPLVPISIDKPATSSPSEADFGRGPEKGNDGNLNTRWCANSGEVYHWWQVDLMDFYDISAVEIIWEKKETYGFAIEVSADNISWRVAFDNTSNLKQEQVSSINLSEKNIRYVKIQMKSLPNDKVYASFIECNVFGVLSNIYEFAKSFSNIQGNNGWYYKEFANGAYKDLIYNTSIGNGIWQGTHEWCRIYKPAMLHPGTNQDVVLAFKCPKSGRINISGNVKKENILGGDGVKVNIKYNNNKVWPLDNEWQLIKYNDDIGYNQDITLDVEKDGVVYFTVNNSGNGEIGQDNTFWNPKIVYVSYEFSALSLQGFFGSKDKHYLNEQYSEIIQESTNKQWDIVGWKGEKITSEIILWTDNDDISSVYVKATDLKDNNGNIIAQENITFNFLKYVQAEGSMIPDILDNVSTVTIKAKSIQPLWVTIKIPNNAMVGKYMGQIAVYGANIDTINFTINLEILNMELPASDNWTFHLDLWQNPYAVARYFNVPLWSTEHINYLKPHLKLLKSAGQKVITTTIMKDPWNSQTYDPYDGMVKWTKETIGTLTFTFNYTDFDRYVQLCMEVGIKNQINCYSMVPWNNRVFYFDRAQNKEVSQSFTPGSADWTTIWKQFITSFVSYLKTKGWENITYVAMDERPTATMNAVFNLLQGTPLKISGAMAYDHVSYVNSKIHDISIAMRNVENEAEVAMLMKNRRNMGFNTTTYLATGDYPNSFTKSNPAESAWIGWYTSKLDADGFLRWAYDSWVEDPLVSTDHVKFESGDCFQVYPERSSVRFERLIEGIQDNEKIRYIMKNHSDWQFEVNKILNSLQRGKSLGDGVDFGVEVNTAKKSLEKIVRRILAGEKPAVSISINKPATSSPSEAAYGRGPEKGNDGALNTRWCANTGEAYHWWQVDLMNSYDISAVEIVWEKNEAYGFAIEVSSDNASWKTVFDNTNNLKKEQVSSINLSEKNVRYVKIQMKSLPSIYVYASFFECNVFGTLSN